MKILFLDIETSPNKVYAWGLWKQNIAINQIEEPGYTLCWAAKWNDSKEIMFDSIYHSSEKKMLKGVWKLLDEADAIVHYNGKNFDIPTLNKEFVVNGILPPSPFHHIDLLEVVKKRFRFPSNKLDYVCQALGIGAKVQHKGMDLWRDCMAGDEAAWNQMQKYNKGDVILLPKLYEKLLPWIKDHPNHALYADSERPVCTNCGSHKLQKRGLEKLKVGVYQRYRCNDCGTWVRGRFTTVEPDKSKNILTQSKL